MEESKVGAPGNTGRSEISGEVEKGLCLVVILLMS